MKRLVTLTACLAMLASTGCANGVLCGGLFNGSNSGCNSRPGLFGGNGLLSDGPLRQFMRGDACDNCNAAAGQVAPAFAAPACDACNSAVSGDPYAMPVNAMPARQTTSFYPTDSGVSLGQPVIHNGVSPIDAGAIMGATGSGDAFDGGLSDPPGMN